MYDQIKGENERAFTVEQARDTALQGNTSAWVSVLGDGQHEVGKYLITHENLTECAEWLLSLQPVAVGGTGPRAGERDVQPGELKRRDYNFGANEIKPDQVKALLGSEFNAASLNAITGYSFDKHPKYSQPTLEIPLGKGIVLYAVVGSVGQLGKPPEYNITYTYLTAPMASDNTEDITGINMVEKGVNAWKATQISNPNSEN